MGGNARPGLSTTNISLSKRRKCKRRSWEIPRQSSCTSPHLHRNGAFALFISTQAPSHAHAMILTIELCIFSTTPHLTGHRTPVPAMVSKNILLGFNWRTKVDYFIFSTVSAVKQSVGCWPCRDGSNKRYRSGNFVVQVFHGWILNFFESLE